MISALLIGFIVSAAPTKAKAIAATAEFLALVRASPGRADLVDKAKALAELRAKAGLATDAAPEHALGQKAYDAHNFGIACVHFKRAVDQDPTDGSLWADFGLCAFKVGNTAAGTDASNIAVAIGDDPTRRNALFNAAKHGQNVDSSAPPDHEDGTPGGAGTLKSPAGCEADFAFDSVSWNRSGCDARYCYHGSRRWVFIDAKAEAVEACANAFREGLEKEEQEAQTSSRQIGSTVADVSCATILMTDSVDASSNDGAGSADYRPCHIVYANACRGIVSTSCGGPIEETTLPVSPP